MSATAAARTSDDPTHQPNASTHDLGRFHEKYRDRGDANNSHHHSNDDDHDTLPPLLRFLSQANAAANVNVPPQRSRRQRQQLREKRRYLRELQEWEYTNALAQQRFANAGPVGLLGFGMTTILLNLHNTGHYKLDTVVPAMGICFGGGAQLIAGLLEWVRGNTFAAVAFTSYGAFWLSLVCIWMLPNASFIGTSAIEASSRYFLGSYLILWGVFSFFMMLCTLRMNLVMFLLFFTVTLLFLWLGGANMADNARAVHACGYEGIVCGCLALYLAFAEILNEVWDCVLLPVFPMTQVLDWLSRSRDLSLGRSHSDAAARHSSHSTAPDSNASMESMKRNLDVL